MGSAHWFIFTGILLLLIGIATAVLRKLPISTSVLYLAIGILVGPTGLGLLHFNPFKQSVFLEALTEVAVLLSLFSAGVKMPMPFQWRQWRVPISLATVSMVISVALMAVFAHFVLSMNWGLAILLGALLAPTDPVLATDVQVRRPGDSDDLRFSLTCEAGMNDGSAFPFVVLGMGLLGLHKIGDFGMRWLCLDVLWATIGDVVIGCCAGYLLGYVMHRIHKRYRQGLLDEFLGLGLIGLVYGISEYCHVWGFLAVFFAASALRYAECRFQAKEQLKQQNNEIFTPISNEPLVSSSSLIFNEYLERLSELVLILIVGGMLFLNSWSWRAVGLALFLFFVARPVSVYLGLFAQKRFARVRNLSAWFGVRGIGSLYYLMYVINKGLSPDWALELIHLTLIVITLSIILHGVTVRPLLSKFWH